MTNPMAGKGPFRSSSKVQSATDSAASNDVDNFNRSAQLTGANPIKIIASFAELGESLKRSGTFTETAQKIAQISELAESTCMQEAGDWFDGQTVKRNMKELKTHAKNFNKIAEEMDTLHQRATALYDDMGNVLSRYFEMTGGEDETPEEAPFGGQQAPKFDGAGGNPQDDMGRHQHDMQDDELDDGDDDLGEGVNRPRGFGYGERVKHEKYGTGEVRSVQGHYVTVKWDNPEKIGVKLTKPGIGTVDQRDIRHITSESAVAPNKYNARRASRLPKAQRRVQGGLTQSQIQKTLNGKKVTEQVRKYVRRELAEMIKEGKIKLPVKSKNKKK